jgi:DNA-binding beta-propeller fold protein YncE
MNARSIITALTAVAGLGAFIVPTVAQSPDTPRPAVEGTRGPSALAFSADGKLVYVVEQDEGKVAILEADTGKLVTRVSSGGTQPTGLALSADGKTLAIANSFSGSAGLIDLDKRSLRATVPLPGEPHAIIATGGAAYVSLGQLGRVTHLDLVAGKAVGSTVVGRNLKDDGKRAATVAPETRPRALSLTTDGNWLLSAQMTGGTLSLLNLRDPGTDVTVPLPAVNLRGVAVSADGRTAYVSGQRPNNAQPTEHSEAMWSNTLSVVSLAGAQSRYEGEIVLDQPGSSAADPGAVLTGADGSVYVTLGGAHAVARVRGRQITRVRVGANPRALARRPGKAEIWVANHLGNSLTVLDPDLKTLRTVELEPPTRPDIRLKGRWLFTSAHVTRGGMFTCSSCHPDGGVDGLSWKFAHMSDGVAVRNTRPIRGAILLTPPYRWSGKEVDFEDFVQDEVVGLLRSPKMPHSDLHAYWDLVNELPAPPNPRRGADGKLTSLAQFGKTLFEGKAGCDSCHAGPQRGGNAKKEWVGTTAPALKLDVPHLTGVHETAPYLHDGRALTLEEVFRKHNTGKSHGDAHLLQDKELDALLTYVREL